MSLYFPYKQGTWIEIGLMGWKDIANIVSYTTFHQQWLVSELSSDFSTGPKNWLMLGLAINPCVRSPFPLSGWWSQSWSIKTLYCHLLVLVGYCMGYPVDGKLFSIPFLFVTLYIKQTSVSRSTVWEVEDVRNQSFLQIIAGLVCQDQSAFWALPLCFVLSLADGA